MVKKMIFLFTNIKNEKKTISVFTNIEEYQLFQIGEYFVVEGTHVKQVIQVLVGALDYHFITSCIMISNALYFDDHHVFSQ